MSSSSHAARAIRRVTSAIPLTSSLLPSSRNAAQPGALRRVLGLGFGLAVIVGSTLGIGILRTPGLVAGQLPTPASILLVWIVGGIYTLVSAMCFAQLGTMLPREGGYYVYARHAFGDWVGFVVGWTDWLTYCAVLGYVSIAMSEFVGALIPAAADHTAPVAIALLVGFVALQWAGVRISSRFQEWTTALKFLAFLALVVAALAVSGSVTGGAGPGAAASPVSLGGLVGAAQVVVI